MSATQRRPVGDASVPADIFDWQELNVKVPDSRLYDHLLRLAILVYRLEPRKSTHLDPPSGNGHMRKSSTGSINVQIQAKLPKGALKTLMKHLNDVAMNATGESAYDQVRRSCYLSFYAMVLNAKTSDRDAYEEMKLKPEALIVRFLSCVNKQLVNYPQLQSTKTTNEFSVDFVNLLLSIVRQEKGTSALVQQLEDYKTQWQSKQGSIPSSTSSTQLGKLVTSDAASFDIKEMDLAQYVAHVLGISLSTAQNDIARLKASVTESSVSKELEKYQEALRNNQHHIYSAKDFTSSQEWESWKLTEIRAVDQIKPATDESLYVSMQGLTLKSSDLVIPPDPKSFYLALLRNCLRVDSKLPNLLSNQSIKLLNTAATWWRISPETRAWLVIWTAKEQFNQGGPVSVVIDSFVLAQHLPKVKPDPWSWPHVDYSSLSACITDMQAQVYARLDNILRHIFDPKVPKIGPYIELMEDYLLRWGGASMSDSAISRLRKAVEAAGVADYDRLLCRVPRDSTLDIGHIHELGQSIVNNAKRLQKKYKYPLFDKISIAKLVCAKQLKLFGVDFLPMFKHCMSSREESEGPSFSFEDLKALYSLLVEMEDLYKQVSLSDGFQFNIEKLLYQNLVTWAKDSSKVAQDWVEPAIQQDSFLPLDLENHVVHSSSVSDLFTSFHAPLKLIDETNWRNQYHVAKVLTALIEGISTAISAWGFKVYLMFCQDLKATNSSAKSLQHQSRQERWLAMAKEAVNHTPREAPEPYQFQTETCVRLNDVAKSYELLAKMEENMNSDAISKRILIEEKRQKQQAAKSYLFTVSVVSATGLAPHESKGTRDTYVTLIDQENRKQLGKTHVVYSTTEPRWSQQFELELSIKPKLIKVTIWDEVLGSHHDLCGRAMLKLDPKEFGGKEYGTISRWLDLDTQGKIRVDVSLDVQQDDIRFYFGKALRFLRRTQDEMIQMIVDQFAPFIRTAISVSTISSLINRGRFGMDTFQTWLGTKQDSRQVLTTEQVEDVLQPLFDYLNSNFATLASVLTQDLKLSVMSKTWEVVLDTIDAILLPPLEARKTTQAQLSSKEVEILFIWLAALKDFFHNEGAGPDMQTLQGQKYQQLMSISNHYTQSTGELKEEAEKVHRANMRAFTQTNDLMERSQSCMFHRSRTVMQQNREQLRQSQLAAPEIDNVILRILRTRGELAFIEKHLRYRERTALKRQTDLTLQGYPAI